MQECFHFSYSIFTTAGLFFFLFLNTRFSNVLVTHSLQGTVPSTHCLNYPFDFWL